MLAVFVYGMGIAYLLTAMMGYEIGFFWMFLVNMVSFLLVKTLFNTKKSTFISLSVLVIGLILAAGVLYYSGQLPIVIKVIMDFLTPYTIALKGASIALGPIRQLLVALILSLLLYKVIDTYKDQKFSFHIFAILSMVLLIYGFLGARLSSSSDRMPVLVFFVSQILFYFHHFYQQSICVDERAKEKYRFWPFTTIIIYYMLGVVIVAFAIYHMSPFPFYREPVSAVLEEEEEDKALYERYQQIVDMAGNISDSFTFAGIELMQVKRTDTRYLKGFVYEVFDGEWSQAEEPTVFEEVSLEDYTVSDTVEVIYTGLLSPAYFTAGYRTNNLTTNDDIYLEHDPVRNTYKIVNYDYRLRNMTIAYTYEALRINTKDSSVIELLQSTNNDINISGTEYELSEEFDYIKEFTADIVTKDMTNYEKTMAVINYLRDHYTYNIEPVVPLDDKADRIRFFLMNSEEGFCQHFTTAAILMLRNEGIPARYVTGYLIDEDVDYDAVQYDYSLMSALSEGRLQVKDSDAHTWMEVYFSGVGWIPFETTALAEGGFRRPIIENEEDGLEETETVQKLSDETILYLRTLGIVLSSIIAFVGLILYFRMIYRRKKIYKEGNISKKVLILYRLINDYLNTVGCKRYTYETHREYAERIDGYGLSEIRLKEMVPYYEGAFYGQYDIEEDLIEKHKQLLSDIKTFARANGRLLTVLRVHYIEKTSI